MSESPHILVPSRFRGPPTSGNGGYTAGLLAEQLGQPLEVTLRSPPPLDRALSLARATTDTTPRLLDGDKLIAEAKPATLALDVPTPPSFDEAREWSKGYAGFSKHALPECFVCGPARAEGDGLRIFPGPRPRPEPGPSPDRALLAAPWVAHPSLASAADGGSIPVAVAWAALDCAGYFASAHPTFALLGKMCAHVPMPLTVAERYVVIGWSLGVEGRKHHAATAIFDESGTLRGSARQTWIAIG